MNCEKTQEFFSAYLEGELSEATKLAVDKHFSECRSCKTEYADFTDMWSLLGSMDEAPVPVNLGQYIGGRLNADLLQKNYPKAIDWRLWLRKFAVGGGIAAIAIVGLVKYTPVGNTLNAMFIPGFQKAHTSPVAAGTLDASLTLNGDKVGIHLTPSVDCHATVSASVEGGDKTVLKSVELTNGGIDNTYTTLNAPTEIDVVGRIPGPHNETMKSHMFRQVESHFFLPKGDATDVAAIGGKAEDVLLNTAQRYGVAIKVEGSLPQGDMNIDASGKDVVAALQTSPALSSANITLSKNLVRIHLR